jgi:hypothetical protein
MKTASIVLGALVLCASAHATQRLSYDQVKEACRNPGNFHNQIQPANMEITCSDVQTRWIPVSQGEYTLPRMRKVTMTMTSDKYDVPGSARDVATPQQGGECPRFKEVIEKIQTTRSTTCDEILGFNGTEIQYCTGVLDELRNSNPGAITIIDSGRNVNLCSPQLPTPPAPPAPAPKPVPAPTKPAKPTPGK